MKFPIKNARAAKLSPEQVMEMRRLYQEGYTQGRLSREFEISINQVGRIVRGEVWQSLPMMPSDKDAEESLQRLLEKSPPMTLEDKLKRDIQKAKEGDKMIDELKGGEEHDAGYE